MPPEYEQLSLLDAAPTAPDADDRRLKLLDESWTPETLSREFLLTSADLLQVQRCVGSHNRLGFALHLVVLRLVHIPLATLEGLPDAIVHFVALQLAIDPAVLGAYPQRAQTRDDHLTRIRQHLGVRAYAVSDAEPLRAYLIQRALQRDDPAILLDEGEEWLRRMQILFPALSTLQRLVGEARERAEVEFSAVIVGQITPQQRTAMLALVEQPHGKRGTTFAWLKDAAPTATVKALRNQIAKRQMILETEAHALDLTRLNRNRVLQIAQLGRGYYASNMRRFSVDKQLTILGCLLQTLLAEVTDDFVEMVDVLVGRIFTEAEKERNDLLTTHGKAINLHLRRFLTVSTVLLNPDVTDADVRRVAFQAVPQQVLQQSVDDSVPILQPDDYNVFAFLDSRYSHLRTFLPLVLESLPLTGTGAARPILDALAWARTLDATTPKWKTLPADAPCDFVPARWRSCVIQPDGTLNHRMWMLCLAEQLRNGLRASDILVPGSRQHRDWRSYLHPESAWGERRTSWFADEWHGGSDPDVYLERLRTRFDATVAQVEADWENNTFARIEKERLVLRKDEKITIPPRAQALRDAIVALLPRIKLPDLLIEVDRWVGIRRIFTHPNEPTSGSWSVRNEQLDATIFAVLLAQGCNLPLSTMADATELPYHQLINTSDWYVREECIRAAIIRLVDYQHQLPLAATFGPGTAAMSDGIRFGVSARSLHARHNPKLPVRRHGLTLYDMTSDQGSQPYMDVIRCDLREAPAALDAALHHETELALNEHMTDTHGYTDLIFGLFELESRIFSPRIRDLPAQILYPMGPDHKKGKIGSVFRGPMINPAHIKRYWDEMHRIAASLKDGTVTAKLLVSKLHALKRQSGGHKGAQELGRVFKTMAALRYISDESYRRRILQMLNKGELLHALARELFFGQQGLFREHDLASQLNRATCMSLLINAIIVWNTRYMMQALDHLRAAGYEIHDEDLVHLTPMLWEHIAIHGTYQFNVHHVSQLIDFRPLRVKALTKAFKSTKPADA